VAGGGEVAKFQFSISPFFFDFILLFFQIQIYLFFYFFYSWKSSAGWPVLSLADLPGFTPENQPVLLYLTIFEREDFLTASITV
jgi:hypothetical protein